MYCSFCGASPPSGALVCPDCGRPLDASGGRAASIIIGRDPTCDVVLPAHDSRISRRHARIRRSPSGELWIDDLGSANGVSLNHQPIQTSRLQPTDRIDFGSYTLPPELWLPRLEVALGWMRMGRDPSLELVLPAHIVAVSSRHARIRPTGPSRWELEDLGSRNGTFVNGARIQRASITATDQVSLGAHPISLPHLLKASGARTFNDRHPSPVMPRPVAAGAPVATPSGRSSTPWIFGLAAAVGIGVLAIVATQSASLPAHVVAHQDVTDASGTARFVDAQTGEPVNIHVVSKNPGRPETPMASVQVGFLDTDGYEAFAASDPTGRHHPTLEVYPHNSSHTLSMTPASVRPFVKKTLRGEPAEYLLNDLSDGCSDARYLTREELEFRNETQMWILKPVLGKSALFLGFASNAIKALEYVQGRLPPSCYLDCYSIWEPGGNLHPPIRITTPADASLCTPPEPEARPDDALSMKASGSSSAPAMGDCSGWEREVSRCVDTYCANEGGERPLCRCWQRGSDLDPRSCRCAPKQFDAMCMMIGADKLEAPSCEVMRNAFAGMDRGCMR